MLAEENQAVTNSECAFQVTAHQYIKTQKQSLLPLCCFPSCCQMKGVSPGATINFSQKKQKH